MAWCVPLPPQLPLFFSYKAFLLVSCMVLPKGDSACHIIASLAYCTTCWTRTRVMPHRNNSRYLLTTQCTFSFIKNVMHIRNKCIFQIRMFRLEYSHFWCFVLLALEAGARLFLGYWLIHGSLQSWCFSSSSLGVDYAQTRLTPECVWYLLDRLLWQFKNLEAAA